MRILPVILSGGLGTRLWPLSRGAHPKHLQKLCGNETLLQQTARRLPAGGDMLPPVIVCNDEQRFVTAEQLREAGVKPSLIALESTGRGTAPALAISALWTDEPANTVLVAMPADHFIAEGKKFENAISLAARLAMSGRLMTLGIAPTAPRTGFGYIEKGAAIDKISDAFAVSSFKEKPDAETAASYIADGGFLWNSGIFVFRADVYLAELELRQPKIISACRNALARGKKDLDFLRLDASAFEESPDLSVDYAVMEHTRNAGVLAVDFGWSDIGGWPALWQIGDRDENGNVIVGDVMARHTRNSYIHSEDRLIAALGLDGIVVVETADALLVADIRRAEEVKEIVTQLRRDNRNEGHNHERVYRPWGYYERLSGGARFQVKLIMVKPGGKLSLQLHNHRSEHWTVVSGKARVTMGEEATILCRDQTSYVPSGTSHRLENAGDDPLIVIEVQSGDYLGEDDIVRFDDVYRRS